ncbi:signal peptidase I [Curtobacterium sp. Leaf261]|uniref:signal peptidase I n=1 Tax=Curtobacterium sp. Leaf261 TaxID=1736311 RepID=UPI0006F6457A|nr:signal peptidase I [Curtobacterium sp. Leaf261]KQO60255.1 hypothetical protein ASF23_14930 [Curtobacterium sp. Leaf261]
MSGTQQNRHSVRGRIVDALRCRAGLVVVITAVTARTILLTAGLLMLWAAVPTVFGATVTTVQSGSMEPAIRVGDVVTAVTVDPGHLTEGRVALVAAPDRPERRVLHRIVDVEHGAVTLRGDANPQPDAQPVPVEHVVGVGVLRVPWIGLPGTWVRTGAVPELVVLVLALGVLLRASTSDRNLRRGMEPCVACGAPSSGDLHRAQQADRARRHLALPTAAAVLVGALVIGTGVSASFTAGVSTAADLDTARFPCMRETVGSPLLAYGFGEPDGTDIDDVTGGGAEGSLFNAVRVDASCAGNPYIHLDGTTGAVYATKRFSAPQQFTIQAWFRAEKPQGKVMGFSSAAFGGSGSFDRHMYVGADGRLVFGVTNGSARVIQSTARVDDRQWHHAVGVMGSGGMQLWVDGVLQGQNTNARAAAYNGYWRVGLESLYGWPNRPVTHYFDGDIDSVAVWHTALDQSAIHSLWEHGR